MKGVVMDQEQLGSLMICQQFTAKFQHPAVTMVVGEDSGEELVCNQLKALWKSGGTSTEGLAGWRKTQGEADRALPL